MRNTPCFHVAKVFFNSKRITIYIDQNDNLSDYISTEAEREREREQDAYAATTLHHPVAVGCLSERGSEQNKLFE
jgi:hypothetical protein